MIRTSPFSAVNHRPAVPSTPAAAPAHDNERHSATCALCRLIRRHGLRSLNETCPGTVDAAARCTLTFAL